MKTFKFKYTLTIWILLGVVLALSVAGIAWNIFTIVQFAGLNLTKTVSSIIMCVLCAFLGFLATSIMISGKYVVKNDAIISYMGIIKTVFPIKDVTEITHFKKSDKLVLYYKPDKYVVIVIDPLCYDDFVKTVRQINPMIIFDSQIDGEELPK